MNGLILLAFSALLAAEPAGAPYVFTPIDVPGATSTWVNGINNHGQVVGDFRREGVTVGFMFDGETFTTLSFPGAKHTAANGINDSGQIVGSAGESSPELGNPRAYLFDRGQYTTLAAPDGSIVAEDINNRGQITGTRGAQGAGGAFLLDGEDWTWLSVPGTVGTQALGLNDAGAVVGTATIQLRPPPGPDDVVFGRYVQMIGFRYDADGFHESNCYSWDIWLTDIDNAGRRVGWYEPDTDIFEIRGFFWDEAGQGTRIEFPGADYTVPLGLNDRGQIVGYYQDATPGSGRHGFIATPVPEPSTCVLLLGAVGCAGCLLRWRRRENTP